MTKGKPQEPVQLSKDRTKLYLGLVVFITSFVIYANSFSNDFNIDDALYTTELNTVSNRGLDAIEEIFTTHTFHEGDAHYEYRPLTMLTFAIQHEILGDEPSKSHFISVLLYGLTCLLIFRLLCKWFHNEGRWFAFFVSLLFAVHPLHTEIVNNIKSRDELLAMLLGVGSLLFLWKGIETKRELWFLLSPLLLFGAFLSKTTAIPLLLLFPLSLYYYTSLKPKNIAVHCLPAVIVFIIFAAIYFSLPPTVRQFDAYENPLYIEGLGMTNKLAISFYMMGWYLYLHFIPHPLVFFYGYAHVPLVSFANVWVIVSLLLYAALIMLVIKGVKKKTTFSCGAIIYLVSIILFANPLLAAPGGMAERFAYASSLGFCIMVCSLLYSLFKIQIPYYSFTTVAGKRVVGIVVIVCIIFGAKTIARNPDWKDRGTLYAHDIQHLKLSAKANMLYGEYLLERVTEYKDKASGSRDRNTQRYFMDSAVYYHNKAKEHLLEALRVSPDYGTAVNNMAVVYFQEDSFSKAKEYLLKADQLTPNNADVIYNIGIVYNMEKKTDSAISNFQRAITANLKYMMAYKSLSDIYLNRKDTVTAIQTLRAGVAADPENAAPYGELANIALLRNDTLQAVAYCEKAVELKGAPLAMVYFLAGYYDMKGNAAKAGYYRNKLSAIQNSSL